MSVINAAADLKDAVPIREIARITGINSVTLRAWERRYGLLKPMRTNKGHRLYSLQDVARVQEIQTWLERGLAISKVCDILANKEDVTLGNFDSAWVDNARRVTDAIFDFKRIELERILEELLALYPAYILADRLMPLVLAKITSAQAAQYQFFNAVLLEHLYRVSYRQRQTAKGTRILVLSHSANESPLSPLFFNYCLLVNEYQAEYVGYLAAREAMLCAAALTSELVVVAGYDAIDTAELQNFLHFWREKCSQPLLLLGAIGRLYNASLQKLAPEESSPVILACETQQQAINIINKLTSDLV
jgi:MerR family transcriptional regulator, light-induced transcriptional regulator